MLGRLFHSLIAFGVVFAAYQVYALVVTPIIEPKLARQATPVIIDDEPSRNVGGRYRKMLAAYFPQTHWALTSAPKVIKSGKLMLVLDDYQRDNRGRVDLTKCAVLMFPTEPKSPTDAPTDAVILEAPGGARLQFDENFNPTRGKIGRVTSGEFPGKITIRSGMEASGPADDLWIETRDLRMNESTIFTYEDVSFRYSGNVGRGRHMEIKLLEDEHARRGTGDAKIAGIESVEIFENVKLKLEVGKVNPLQDAVPDRVAFDSLQRGSVYRPTAFRQPTASPTAASPTLAPTEADVWADVPTQAAPRNRGAILPQAESTTASNNTPLEIACSGSLLIDLIQFTATFQKDVAVWQLNLQGQSDQLSCDRLALVFTPQGRNGPLSPEDDPDVGRTQRKALGKLEARSLIATGNPVRVDSPTRDIAVRGRRLEFQVADRRVTLSGGTAVLTRGEDRVQAPIISYQHPPEESPAAIGELWIAGPGELQVTPSDGDASRAIKATWQALPGVEYPVRLNRTNKGQPLLTLLGNPEITSGSVGRLLSKRIRLYLREVAADGDGPAIELGGSQKAKNQAKLALLPDRIDASDGVEIISPDLAGKTEQLIVWFRQRKPGQAGANKGQTSGRKLGGDSSVLASRQEQAGIPKYQLNAKRTQIEVEVFGKTAEPTLLVCDGGVTFGETPNPQLREQPLRVSGQRIRATNLHKDTVKLTVYGQAEGQPIDANARATIQARGMTLRAADVHLDQEANRMWADGAGDALVQSKRDLLGQTTGGKTNLSLRWRGGLVFDGQRITVRDNVFGEGPHDWLRCNTLVATLTKPIQFGSGAGQHRVDIAQIDCQGGVTIDHRTVDAGGQRSHERAQLKTLQVNQRSGDIVGTGPGSIRSVHLSDSGSFLSASDKPSAASTDSKLRFLRVHFQQGMSGNINNRVIRFHQRVQSVYGPVLAWEQEIPLDHPQGLPPNTAALDADLLEVYEDPLARYTNRQRPSVQPESNQRSLLGGKSFGPIELKATGNVRLEGAAEGKGLFTAQAVNAVFNQLKEQFVLEGDGRRDATIWVQRRPGEEPTKNAARKITYWQETGKVKVEGFRSFEHNASPRQPSTATRPSARR